jgi:hypothetical protein
MTINCSGTGIVVNYADKDNHRIQISKKTSAGACPAIALDGAAKAGNDPDGH